MPHLHPVRSSAIAAIGYDPERRELEVEFPSGRSYTHYDVPEEVYEEFMASGSKGTFYNLQIKGVY